MNSEEKARSEAKQARKAASLLYALDDGLEYHLERCGYTLHGLSARLAPGDCLITLRLSGEGGRFVSFAGGGSFANAILKILRDARSGSIKVKEDEFFKQ